MMEKASRKGTGKEGGKGWCFIHLKTSISQEDEWISWSLGH